MLTLLRVWAKLKPWPTRVKHTRFVCLASSRKHAGKCIAGKLLTSDHAMTWIRLVNEGEKRELQNFQTRYRDGAQISVLDIVELNLERPAPRAHQAENYVASFARRWVKKGSFPIEKLECLVDKPFTLWENGCQSRFGVNDRVPGERAEAFSASLFFIKPRNLALVVQRERNADVESRLKLRARFTYRDQP